jgi:hypothetical protein
MRLFVTLLVALAAPLSAQLPPLEVRFSGFLFGNWSDAVQATAVDPEGNVWVAGTSVSNFMYPSPPFTPIQMENAGGRDIFVAKYRIRPDRTAEILYFSWLGGSGNEDLKGMAIDAQGRVYLTGITDSIDFRLGGDALQTQIGGNVDAFVSIIDTRIEGEFALVYSTYFGGGNRDEALAIAVTPDGSRVAIVGNTRSEDLPAITGNAQSSLRGGGDAFIMVLDRGANSRWATLMGGDSTDVATAVKWAEDGSLWFAGYTGSSDFPVTFDAYRALPSLAFDGFLMRLDPQRPGLDAILYGTYFGGSGSDVPTAIELTANGQLWVAGHTSSPDLAISTSTAPQTDWRGGSDAFLMRFNLNVPPEFSLEYSTYFGGAGFEIVYGMAISGPRVALAGYQMFGGLPSIGNLLQPSPTSAFADNLFVVINTSVAGRDAVEYSGYIGGSLTDVSTSIAADAAGSFYIGGYTLSNDFPVTDGSARNNPPANPTGTLVKLGPPITGTLLVTAP